MGKFRFLMILSLFLVSLSMKARGQDSVNVPLRQLGYGELSCVAVSNDETMIVTGAANGRVVVWDISTNQVIKTFPTHNQKVVSIDFTADDERILTASSDNSAAVWDIKTGERLVVLPHERDVNRAIFFPDGNKIITACGDHKIRLWDAGDGTLLEFLDNNSGNVYALSFTDSETGLLTGSAWGYIRSLDVQTGDSIYTFRSPTEYGIHSIGLSPDKSIGAYSTGQDKIYVWNVQTGDSLKTLQYHSLVAGLSFSPDGRTLVSGGQRTVKYWDVASGEEIQSFQAHGDYITAVEYLSEGTRLLTAAGTENTGMIGADGRIDNMVKLWNTQTGELTSCLRGHTGLVEAIDVSSDGTRVLTASHDSTVKIWDVGSGDISAEFPAHRSGHRNYATAAAFGVDDNMIATGGRDQTIILWDGGTGDSIRTFRGHTNTITSVAFSADGRFLLSAAYDSTARIWEIESGIQTNCLIGHSGGVVCAKWAPGDSVVLTASLDSTAKLWNALTGESIRTLRGHSSFLLSADISGDGTKIVTGGGDRKAILWDAQTGTMKREFDSEDGCVYGVYFFPGDCEILTVGGQYPLRAGSENRAKIWNVDTGVLVRVFTGNTNALTCASIIPDGKNFLTGSKDGIIQVWSSAGNSTSLGKKQLSRAVKRMPTEVTFSNNNRPLFVFNNITGRLLKPQLRIYQTNGRLVHLMQGRPADRVYCPDVHLGSGLYLFRLIDTHSQIEHAAGVFTIV